MPKLKLIADPTFKAKVAIPIAGGAPEDVEMTFKHRTKTALDEFIATRQDKTDIESFLEIVAGWELEDTFNEENVRILLENHIGAALSAYRTYVEELYKAREKNS